MRLGLGQTNGLTTGSVLLERHYIKSQNAPDAPSRAARKIMAEIALLQAFITQCQDKKTDLSTRITDEKKGIAEQNCRRLGAENRLKEKQAEITRLESALGKNADKLRTLEQIPPEKLDELLKKSECIEADGLVLLAELGEDDARWETLEPEDKAKWDKRLFWLFDDFRAYITIHERWIEDLTEDLLPNTREDIMTSPVLKNELLGIGLDPQAICQTQGGIRFGPETAKRARIALNEFEASVEPKMDDTQRIAGSLSGDLTTKKLEKQFKETVGEIKKAVRGEEPYNGFLIGFGEKTRAINGWMGELRKLAQEFAETYREQMRYAQAVREHLRQSSLIERARAELENERSGLDGECDDTAKNGLAGLESTLLRIKHEESIAIERLADLQKRIGIRQKIVSDHLYYSPKKMPARLWAPHFVKTTACQKTAGQILAERIGEFVGRVDQHFGKFCQTHTNQQAEFDSLTKELAGLYQRYGRLDYRILKSHFTRKQVRKETNSSKAGSTIYRIGISNLNLFRILLDTKNPEEPRILFAGTKDNCDDFVAILFYQSGGMEHARGRWDRRMGGCFPDLIKTG